MNTRSEELIPDDEFVLTKLLVEMTPHLKHFADKKDSPTWARKLYDMLKALGDNGIDQHVEKVSMRDHAILSAYTLRAYFFFMKRNLIKASLVRSF
jgi:hypothetical protein